MTKMQRFKKILVGLLMLVCCAVLIAEPEIGLYIVALILCVSMLVYGIRCLILYFKYVLPVLIIVIFIRGLI